MSKQINRSKFTPEDVIKLWNSGDYKTYKELAIYLDSVEVEEYVWLSKSGRVNHEKLSKVLGNKGEDVSQNTTSNNSSSSEVWQAGDEITDGHNTHTIQEIRHGMAITGGTSSGAQTFVFVNQDGWTKVNKDSPKKLILDVLCVDHSGSVYSISSYLKNGITGYFENLRKVAKEENIETRMTVVNFDTRVHSFDGFNNVLSSNYEYKYLGGGLTALSRAISEAIKYVQNYIKTFTDGYEVDATITAFTDGMDNQGGITEAKALVEKAGLDGITVALVGPASTNVSAYAKQIGVELTNTVEYTPDEQGINQVYTKMSKSRSSKTKAFIAGESTNVGYFKSVD